MHGCFCYRHPNCSYATTPETHSEFWLSKFEANVQCDSKKEAQLRELGWGGYWWSGNAKLATLESLRIDLGVSSLSPVLFVCRDVTH